MSVTFHDTEAGSSLGLRASMTAIEAAISKLAVAATRIVREFRIRAR